MLKTTNFLLKKAVLKLKANNFVILMKWSDFKINQMIKIYENTFSFLFNLKFKVKLKNALV